MVEEIHSYGLSVEQAYKMKKDGILPEDLAKAIDAYESGINLKCGSKNAEN